MGAFLSYTLSTSLIILLLYPILQQIVNRSISFRFNRAVIICGMVLSLVIPYFFDANAISQTFEMPDVSSDLKGNSNLQFTDIAATESNRQNNSTTTLLFSILILVYFSGIFVLFCREIISFLRLLIMIGRSEKTKNGKYTICRIKDKHTAPFSWSKYIFLRGLEADNTDSIYLHEKAHTDNQHWIDVLFADLFCIILWYNPFAWMTRQLMKLNHEFEADSAVISSGIDTYDYQRLLVIKAMGMRAIPGSNSFAADKRSFRKRVLIMSKKSSSRKPMLIVFFAIPAIIVSGIIVSTPTSAKILSYISNYSSSREIFTLNVHEKSIPLAKVRETGTEALKEEADTVVVIPNPIENQTALAEIIRYSLETINPDKDTKVNIEIIVDEEGRVKDVFADTPDGAQVARAISRKFNGIRLEQITDNGRPVEVHFKIPVHLRRR